MYRKAVGESMYKRIQLVVNPTSGDGNAPLDHFKQILNGYNLEWQIGLSHKKGDGAKIAREAIESDMDLVIVYGGDGTVGDVASALIQTEMPLGILPGGTGNAVALNLQIPQDVEKALDLILHHSTSQRFDVGHITCQNQTKGYFLLRSTIGLYNEMLAAATPELKSQFGSLAYLIGGITSLQESSTLTFNLTIDGEEITVDGHSCIIANTAAIGGLGNFDFAPEVDPDDGLLDVFVFSSETIEFLKAVESHITTDLSAFPHHWEARSVSVKVPPNTQVYGDGEPVCDTDVEIKSMPQSLKILVPNDTSS